MGLKDIKNNVPVSFIRKVVEALDLEANLHKVEMGVEGVRGHVISYSYNHKKVLVAKKPMENGYLGYKLMTRHGLSGFDVPSQGSDLPRE